MPTMNEKVSKYISKFPNQKLMMHHGEMTFTFHNAKIMECIWFAIKTKLTRKPKATDTAHVVDPKSRRVYKHPSEMRLMERFMNQFRRHDGEVNPNKTPPKSKSLRWSEDRGYHYVSRAEEHTTFNRWIKSKNTKPK
jgi:hypothetical protein